MSELVAFASILEKLLTFKVRHGGLKGLSYAIFSIFSCSIYLRAVNSNHVNEIFSNTKKANIDDFVALIFTTCFRLQGLNLENTIQNRRLV